MLMDKFEGSSIFDEIKATSKDIAMEKLRTTLKASAHKGHGHGTCGFKKNVQREILKTYLLNKAEEIIYN